MRFFLAPRQPRGFSAIEILVILLVIGILAAISGPSFSAWLSSKRVSQALVEVEGALQETQAEAIKRGRSCELRIPPAGPTPRLTGDCLVSGDRTLQHVSVTHTNSATEWVITFDFKGRNLNPPNLNTGTIGISSLDSNVQPRCIVVAAGIGLRRSGKYNPGTEACTP